MAFLDNSGDIILDAVLTDLGRMRLAKGDGSFAITQFAIGDDEIDYNLYNLNTPTAQQDLTLLQAPVLEAFTNNTSTLKSKLLSISRTDHLYLPMLKINQSLDVTRLHSTSNALNMFVVAADTDTAQGTFNSSGLAKDVGIIPNNGNKPDGFINGVDTEGTIIQGASYIRIDQGIDNTNVPVASTLDPDLFETQYMIEIDGRLGSIVNSLGTVLPSPNFVKLGESFKGDDDFMQTYYLTLNTDSAFITDIRGNHDPAVVADNEIQGPRGTRLEFKIRTSLEIQQSRTLFTKLGQTDKSWTNPSDSTTASPTVDYIDATIRVTGVTTGYRLDIPIRIVKKV
tara:strand:+ start:1374 stop:2393 length:1020 start_codon:yes stop_codon:yes gene_type:complete